MHQKFKHWIDFSMLSPEHLALFRIFFSLALFLFSGFPRFDWISSFPDLFYSPPLSIASLFEDFPNGAFFTVLNFLLPLLLLFVAIGYKTVWSSISLGIVFIIVSSFEFSFGKINHTHFIPFTLLIFAFSGWGNNFSVDAYQNKSVKTSYNVIPLYALIIAFSYFTSGFSKISGGWLNMDYQAAHTYLIQNFYFDGRQLYLASHALNVNSTFLWELIDYMVVLIEIAPLCFLFNKRLFSVALFFIACFHILVYLIFTISFGFYPLLFTIFIINWKESTTISRLTEKIGKNTAWLSKPVRILLFCTALFVFYCILMYSNIGNLGGEYPLSMVVSLFLSFAIILYFCNENLRIYLRKRHPKKEL